MSTFVPLFHRTWFRATLVCSVLAAAGVGGAYAAFYRYSDFEHLQQLAAESMTGNARKITFDTQVERELLPRPTVILKNVTLSETDGRTPAVTVKEARVGVAWTSLLGNWTVEKLVLNDLATVVTREDDGKWNFADLLDSQNKRQVSFNRIVLNNGNILLQAFGRRIQLNNLTYQQTPQNQTGIPYAFSADASNPEWQELKLKAQGHMNTSAGGFRFPDFVMQFEGDENGRHFSGSLVSNVGFKDGHFAAKDNKLVVRTDRLMGHADVNIANIVGENKYLLLNNINSVFTGSLNANNRLNGTLVSRQAKLDVNQLASDELTVNLSSKTADSDNLNFTAITAANWHIQNGLDLPKFQLSTRQDRPNGLPRFLSDWTGSLKVVNEKNWQAQAQGHFDKHPVALAFEREHNTINGALQLSKIDFANYMDGVDKNIDNPYPEWLTGALVANVDLEVGAMSIPALEVYNIKTKLRATSKEIRLEPFSADLYGGHTEGMLMLNNQQPVQYVMKQKASGVQVRPMMQDLFRNGTIAGKGDVELSFTTTGANRQELTESLSGSLNMNVKDGSWYGINIRELMKAAAASDGTGVLKLTSTDGGTPFDTFEFKSKIDNGVSKHSSNSHFTSPSVGMAAKGETNLYSGRMSEDINLLSNNGKDTLPLRITGTMDNPAISLNYQKITSGLKTPEEKKNAVTEAIKKQWDWMREQGKK